MYASPSYKQLKSHTFVTYLRVCCPTLSLRRKELRNACSLLFAPPYRMHLVVSQYYDDVSDVNGVVSCDKGCSFPKRAQISYNKITYVRTVGRTVCAYWTQCACVRTLHTHVRTPYIFGQRKLYVRNHDYNVVTYIGNDNENRKEQERVEPLQQGDSPIPPHFSGEPRSYILYRTVRTCRSRRTTIFCAVLPTSAPGI